MKLLSISSLLGIIALNDEAAGIKIGSVPETCRMNMWRLHQQSK